MIWTEPLMLNTFWRLFVAFGRVNSGTSYWSSKCTVGQLNKRNDRCTSTLAINGLSHFCRTFHHPIEPVAYLRAKSQPIYHFSHSVESPERDILNFEDDSLGYFTNGRPSNSLDCFPVFFSWSHFQSIWHFKSSKMVNWVRFLSLECIALNLIT